jgi:spore coat polysaccharide biosynthesis protein SpsF
MKTAIIVQARMTSSRLPGKVLMEVLGKPLLEFQIERLSQVRTPHAIVIATTINKTDDPIVAFCQSHGLAFYRGSEQDVLGRYYGAAVEAKADRVIRVTSDCPLIDPTVIDAVCQRFGDGANFDYVSNTVERTYPRGLDVEVFSMKALTEMNAEAVAPYQREHVTPFIHDHPERYRMSQVRADKDQSHFRWTVDTAEDLELIRRILTDLYPSNHSYSTADILALVERQPDLMNINEHIRQKELHS